MSPSTVRTARCVLVWLSTSALLLGGSYLLAADLVQALDATRSGALTDQSFDTLLVWLCSLVTAACCLWLWLMSSLVILSVAGGLGKAVHPPRLRGCPDFFRRTVLVACGVAVVGSMALPANAQPLRRDHGAGSNSAGTLHSQTLAGLPLPERAIQEAPVVGRSPLRVIPVVRSETDPAQVRVRAGDTLWAIAAHTLAPDAAPEAINDRCHDLYELNRSVIGPDPDLIIPGQHLRLER